MVFERAAEVLERAQAAGIVIATAESCTGGMIIGALTDIPGSSRVIDRGFVTYSNPAKVEMLGVRPGTLARVGAVSEEVACEMAEGALARSDASLSVAVTGIAGPGGSDHKPEGLVCFARAAEGGPTHVETITFGAIGRANVRAQTVAHALELLSIYLETQTAL